MSRFLMTVAAIAVLAQAGPTLAQQHGHPGGVGGAGRAGGAGGHARPGATHGGGPEFHGRGFGGLSPGERSHWTGGAWRHEWHDGVWGWWWFLDDDWFYYPEPIYPYPTYIAPPPAPPQPLNVWYRCDDPPGFYPYVETCRGGWRTVPAAPLDLNQTPPPPPVPAPR